MDHNPFPSDMPFEFPPGHRVQICNVIKTIRQLKELHLHGDATSNPKKRKFYKHGKAWPSKKRHVQRD